jgi:hypothetical protein
MSKDRMSSARPERKLATGRKAAVNELGKHGAASIR